MRCPPTGLRRRCIREAARARCGETSRLNIYCGAPCAADPVRRHREQAQSGACSHASRAVWQIRQNASERGQQAHAISRARHPLGADPWRGPLARWTRRPQNRLFGLPRSSERIGPVPSQCRTSTTVGSVPRMLRAPKDCWSGVSHLRMTHMELWKAIDAMDCRPTHAAKAP